MRDLPERNVSSFDVLILNETQGKPAGVCIRHLSSSSYLLTGGYHNPKLDNALEAHFWQKPDKIPGKEAAYKERTPLLVKSVYKFKGTNNDEVTLSLSK